MFRMPKCNTSLDHEVNLTDWMFYAVLLQIITSTWVLKTAHQSAPKYTMTLSSHFIPRWLQWRCIIYTYISLTTKKGKGAYSSSWNSHQNYETPLVKWDHTVLSATRQRWPPRLHPNRAGWYSIYRPHKDERLSWPSWLVTYRNGLPVHRRSPIRVLTGSDVAQLRWSKPTRYH